MQPKCRENKAAAAAAAALASGQELFHQLSSGGEGRKRRTGDKWSEKKEEKIGCWAEVDEWPAERNMGLRKWEEGEKGTE